MSYQNAAGNSDETSDDQCVRWTMCASRSRWSWLYTWLKSIRSESHRIRITLQC